MALFLDYKKEDDVDSIYFESYLPMNYKNNMKLGESVIRMRNVLIVLTILEIFSSIWGFSYFFLRRVTQNKLMLIYIYLCLSLLYMSL